ncbi:hypothetical protein [Bosea sp. (in: a-proteobacteria)]|jgi:hypothetical protein|uniref:hypothetical protein n=1 Tax=Bosea sp. (in: a-proteobacteria) TaxID=1871050 RepID=UPI002DDC961E|nr:hypothetical protein [Bosea sp. (in: a-proteobacteria)]HEV2509718.1 hypothetical protein [Bosea sp. (in: a-proteobacteria)]
MSPLLRRVGFTLSFVIVAMALNAQLAARPTLQLVTQVSDAQIVFEKSSRPRIGRVAEPRRMPRPMAAAHA